MSDEQCMKTNSTVNLTKIKLPRKPETRNANIASTSVLVRKLTKREENHDVPNSEMKVRKSKTFATPTQARSVARLVEPNQIS
jgi:hypothetical protein